MVYLLSLPNSRVYIIFLHQISSDIFKYMNLQERTFRTRLVESLFLTFNKALFKITATNTSTHRQAWAQELNEGISEGFWEQCLANVNDCSVNTRHNLIQFKTTHHLFYWRTKIHRFAPTT